MRSCRHSSLIRSICLFFALCFIWSFVIAPSAIAAEAAKKSAPPARHPAKAKHFATLAERLANMPYAAKYHSAPPAAVAHVAMTAKQYAPVTLLDEVGRLARPVNPRVARGWGQELLTHPAALRAAQIRMQMGEYALAQDQEPHEARIQFGQAQALVRIAARIPAQRKEAKRLYGLAVYDNALASYYQGDYDGAAANFKYLVRPHNGLTGFNYDNAVLWSRHASACAGYHAQHSKLGIPEPTRLDPDCGIASMAARLKVMGLPYDRKTLRAACRVTEEGSSLNDLVAAGPKLGVNVRSVTADEQGLKQLPMPVVAHVERDHFIAVIKADSHGVSYLCSDCGPWPGGRVDLTWKQWRTMNPGVYGVITKPGTASDRLMASLTEPLPSPLQLSYAGDLRSLHLSERVLPPHNLASHVKQYDGSVNWACNLAISSIQCCPENCPTDGGGATQAGSSSDPGSTGNAGHGLQTAIAGASAGDPVNLATGEEEYTPGTDLNVYNPVGPSVDWGRSYESLRNGDSQYQNLDFGQGWSQNYNVGVYDPEMTTIGLVPQGDSATFPSTGIDVASGKGIQWDIVDPSHTVIANSSNPNGWDVESVFDITDEFAVTAPAAAPLGDGYEVRTWQANGSAYFNVIPPGQGGFNTESTSGSRYIIEANGARIPFNAPSVPTASNPRVICSLGESVPMLVEWDYDPNQLGGDYVITFSDRTKWIAAPISPLQKFYSLAQIVDRVGNAITFNYSTTEYPFSYGWHLLSSISNDASTTLLSISRDSNGMVTSVSDAYGRSVYYAAAASPYGSEVGQVSQIVPTGTSGAAASYNRYTYGYQTISATDDDASATFLHTIGVPNPTGSSTESTATINYNQGIVSSLVDANGNSRNYTFGSGDATVVTVKDASDNTVYEYTASYDSYMNETGRTDGKGNQTSAKLYSDPNDTYRPASVTDGNGKTTDYTWDAYGNMLTETPPHNSNRTPAETTNTYDYTKFALGELTQMQEGSKQPTTYTYDDQPITGGYKGSGLLLTETSPQPGTAGGTDSVTTTYAYDLTTYDSGGNVIHQGLGNLLSVTKPGNNATIVGGVDHGITTTYNYTTDGSYSQDAAIGQPVTVTDNLGKVTHLRYDSQSNIAFIMDALGNETDFTYNIANQPLQTTLPATGQQGTGNSDSLNAYLYAGGPLTSVTNSDESGSAIREVNYAYGPEGEKLSVSGSAEPATYTYDALYRVATLTDGNGHATHYYYKRQGYQDAITYPGYSGSTPAYNSSADSWDNISGADSVRYPSYDLDGNLTERIDGNGVETDYTHNSDPESLLTLTHYAYPTGYTGGTAGDVSLSYDEYGRRSGMTDGTGSQSYTYDDLDNMLSDSTTYTGLSARTITYEYNKDGSRSFMSPTTSGVTYSYDAVGRMTGLSTAYTVYASWSYLDNGWLHTQTLDNGVTTAYTYNARGEVTDQQTKNSGGTTLSDFSGQTYDGVGDRTAVIASLPAAPSAYSGTTDYTYDYGQTSNPALNRSQLTEESSTRSGGYTSDYSYDGGTSTGPGNPTSFKGTSHSFNSDNQDSANTFDGNGNPTSYNGSALTYDPENRMTADASSLTAAYTGDGLRAWKDNGGGKTYFYYDGDKPVVETNSSGTIFNLNTFGANGLFNSFNGGEVNYTYDPSGNVAQRLDGSGNVLSSDMYDAYGAQQTTASAPDRFGFEAQSGYYTDAETGLVLCTHRYYDPTNGRWLTRDPTGYNGGVNLYGYVGNDPVNATDPLGLKGLFGQCVNWNKFRSCAEDVAIAALVGCGIPNARLCAGILIAEVVACGVANAADGEAALVPCILAAFSVTAELYGESVANCLRKAGPTVAGAIAVCFHQSLYPCKPCKS